MRLVRVDRRFLGALQAEETTSEKRGVYTTASLGFSPVYLATGCENFSKSLIKRANVAPFSCETNMLVPWSNIPFVLT